MQYDNNYTNKKLQELENQSLPDLSKMDEHWQQMTSLLKPGTTPVKNVFRKKLLFAMVGVAALVIISFFVFRNLQPAHEKSLAGLTKDTLTGRMPVLVDSPYQVSDTMLIRARTTEGRDTILKAVPVNKSSPANNKIVLERFYEQLQKRPQRFQINNLRDTTIHGKEGTRLYIPAQSFDVQGNFTLLLTEFYSVNDMIAQKLTTTCDGRMLITGGMIYLDAKNNDQELIDLKKGALLRLDMPKQDNQQSMELFYGYDYYRNDVTEVMDSINWQRTNQIFTDTKKNSDKILKIFPSRKKINEVDTILVSETGEPRATFDYVATDTTTGKQGIAIKGDSIMLQKFGVNINRLGWINCDRFYNDARPKLELIVELGDNPDNYNTLLLFDNFASILPPSSKKGTAIRFFNLPKGEPVRIISLGIKDGKPVTAMKQATVSNTPVTGLNFEEINAVAYKKKLGQ